jgi:two-component system phosphate regulon sensor histidine kinase PhoR
MMNKLIWRLVLPLGLVIAISMTLLGVLLARAGTADQMGILRQRLTHEANMAGLVIEPLLGNPISTDRLAKEMGGAGGLRLTVVSVQGEVLGDSWEDPAGMENHLYRPEIQDALAGGYGESQRLSTTTDREMLFVAIRLDGDSGTPLALVRAGLPLSEVRALTNRSAAAAAAAVGGSIVLAVIGAWLIARSVTQPVSELTRAVKEVTGGRLGHTISPYGGGEIKELALAFNAMSQELAKVVGHITEEGQTTSAVLQRITDCVILTDHNGNVLLANRAAAGVFGFNDDQVNRRSAAELLRDHEAVNLIRSCLLTGREQSARFESLLRRRYLNAMALPISYGNSTGALLVLQDLTEIIELQSMRKELIANISHDFLTPLAGIRAVTETLQDGALSDPSAAHGFLDRIMVETGRLTQMVTELGELAHIEGGQPQLRMERMDLNRLTTETVEEMQPLAHKHQIILTAAPAEALPAVSGDAERLRHVLLNLLHNAVKFTPAGGKIQVSTSRQDGQVVVTVADTGAGIDPAALPHVFERFYKADHSRSKGGSGLGLAIVKHTVQAHGGRVWVESTPGEGATFSFSLPAEALDTHPALP